MPQICYLCVFVLWDSLKLTLMGMVFGVIPSIRRLHVLFEQLLQFISCPRKQELHPSSQSVWESGFFFLLHKPHRWYNEGVGHEQLTSTANNSLLESGCHIISVTSFLTPPYHHSRVGQIKLGRSLPRAERWWSASIWPWPADGAFPWSVEGWLLRG